MSDVRLVGRMVNFSKLTFTTGDLNKTQVALQTLLGDVTQKRELLVIIDSTERTNLAELFKQVRAYGLQPFAVADGVLTEQAKIRNIPVLSSDKAQRIEAPHEKESLSGDDAPNKQTRPYLAPHIEYSTVVAKQKAHAEHGDIVLLQGCKKDSEVFATGSIHCYGKAQGQLIAGISNNHHACIFCQQFNPQLISIAGTFSYAADIPKRLLGKAVYVCLNEKHELVYQEMTASQLSLGL